MATSSPNGSLRKFGFLLEPSILANGSLTRFPCLDVLMEVSLLRPPCSYVPQIDSLNHNFTVTETLTYAVRLRCADDWNALDGRVHELMELVGMRSVADVRVGKLTGGQFKLLSVAIGLVQRPSVLYLDEPTTGLDSTAASVVMECTFPHPAATRRVCTLLPPIGHCAQLFERLINGSALRLARVDLSAIAKTGVVTLLTVHQPSKSVFDLVDDVILLATDGSLAFSGPTSEAITFFGSAPFNIAFPEDENPADILIEAVSTQTRNTSESKVLNVVGEQPLGRISTLYNQSDTNARLAAELDRSEKNPRVAEDIPNPGFATRLSVLVDKNLRLYWREPGAYLYMTIVVTIFAVFLGTLYYDLDLTTSGLREVRASMFLAIWMALYVPSCPSPAFSTLGAFSNPRDLTNTRTTRCSSAGTLHL
jgi:ABC-type multidrug transport system ATPase subunit